MIFRYSLIILFACGLIPANVHAQEFKAELSWSDKHFVNPPVRGVVKRVLVQAGDRVTSGQSLIEVSDVIYRARVKEMAARVARFTPDMLDAQRELDHANELYERTVLSEVELERAHLKYDRAKGFVDEAAAKLKIAKWDLRNCIMKAPIDGVVVSVDVSPGHVITMDGLYTPLMVVASDRKIRARLLMTSDELKDARVQQKARVNVSGKNYEGIVVEIGIAPDAALSVDVLYPLYVEFEHDGKAIFRAGQKAGLTLQ